jgi:GT2 family glycosyltransferase
VIHDVGDLDEEFTGYGFEDNDYSMRARLKGYALAVAPQVVMAHGDESGRASLTFRKDPRVNRLMQYNRHRFLKKWGERMLGVSGDKLEKLIALVDML